MKNVLIILALLMSFTLSGQVDTIHYKDKVLEVNEGTRGGLYYWATNKEGVKYKRYLTVPQRARVQARRKAKPQP